jgi:hypothetical protein
MTRWLLAAVQALPPLQRALDQWAQRRAMQRRERRMRPAPQRQR